MQDPNCAAANTERRVNRQTRGELLSANMCWAAADITSVTPTTVCLSRAILKDQSNLSETFLNNANLLYVDRVNSVELCPDKELYFEYAFGWMYRIFTLDTILPHRCC